jgi:hypothetical protein
MLTRIASIYLPAQNNSANFVNNGSSQKSGESKLKVKCNISMLLSKYHVIMQIPVLNK